MHEHSVFINHVFGCKDCYAPVNRYCAKGKDLKFEADAAYVASLQKLEERRMAIAFFNRTNPMMVNKLRDRVVEIFEERKARRI